MLNTPQPVLGCAASRVRDQQSDFRKQYIFGMIATYTHPHSAIGQQNGFYKVVFLDHF
jgi:hypothetical protein